MADSSARDRFLRTVREALQTAPRPDATIGDEARDLSNDVETLDQRSLAIAENARAEAGSLLSRLEDSAKQAGWTVTRVDSIEAASRHVETVARDVEARSIVRSAHTVVDGLDLEERLAGSGIEINVMALDGMAEREPQRILHRQRASEAEIGVTGVDYAIAETGTCVLLARKGVSRLVSLLPPTYVAIVQSGEVLPTLDELFTLQRQEHLKGDARSYMNLISGPSRSADIEYTLVTGVHGPGDVHLVLIG